MDLRNEIRDQLTESSKPYTRADVRRALKPLTAAERRFLETYVATWNIEKASQQAGWHAQRGHKFSQSLKFKAHVKSFSVNLMPRIQRAATTAMEQLERLLLEEETPPGVRLKAAQDVLDRAGYKSPDVFVLPVASDRKALEKEVDKLLAEVTGDKRRVIDFDEDA